MSNGQPEGRRAFHQVGGQDGARGCSETVVKPVPGDVGEMKLDVGEMKLAKGSW